MPVELLEGDFEALVRRLGGELLKFDKPVRTVGEAVEASKASLGQVVKSIPFMAGEGPVLVVVDGESRVDLDRLSGILGPVKPATAMEVEEITGFKVGAVPPIGVKVRTIMDPKVLENKYVIGGGGDVDKLLIIDPRKILEYQRAEVLDVKKTETMKEGKR
ncbi:MAG: aminoacyl-tRNA deacylase [Candidatus Bathyarchaeia archaeon]